MSRHLVDPEEFSGFTIERGGKGKGYDVDRFRKKATIENEIDCWLWNGEHKNGYPVFWDSHLQRPMSAARWSYEYFRGPVIPGFQVLHTCAGGKACVNPFHLVVEAKQARLG